jgi:hypothetical protein
MKIELQFVEKTNYIFDILDEDAPDFFTDLEAKPFSLVQKENPNYTSYPLTNEVKLLHANANQTDN